MITAADKRWMDLAYETAKFSPNKGRKTSVVFVRDGEHILRGWNDFPMGVKDLSERLEKPVCYRFIEHAERNAIGFAARYGIRLFKTTAYLPWFPCVECARMLVNAGITRMVCVEPDWNDTMYFFRDSEAILKDAGVEIEYYKENPVVTN